MLYICEVLGLSVRTVESFRVHIQEKLTLKTAGKLSKVAIEWTQEWLNHAIIIENIWSGDTQSTMTHSEMEQGFREVWKMFAETDKRMDQRFRELDQRFKETDQRFKETDQRFKETDQRLDQRFKETDQRLDQLFAQTDQRLNLHFKETSEQIQATGKKVNDLTDKWGMFVEGLVVPAAKRLFQERGIQIREVYHRAEAARNGRSMEVDVLAANGEYAVLIEAKSTLKVEDVNEHLERLCQFKEFFPRYSEAKVIGAVAGIVISEDADKYAYKQGLFVIAQSGDTVKILNDTHFKPKEW